MVTIILLKRYMTSVSIFCIIIGKYKSRPTSQLLVIYYAQRAWKNRKLYSMIT